MREALARGQHAILKIDVQGAQVVKGCVPDALLDLRGAAFDGDARRAPEGPPDRVGRQLELRQRNAALELARKDDYDYVVVNEEGDVDLTAERIDEIISQEERRGSRRSVTV